MPCRDYSDETYLGELNTRLTLKVDKLTRLLCTACTEIDTLGSKFKGIYPSNEELRAWWVQHQKDDKVRRNKEREQKKRDRAEDLKTAKRLIRKAEMLRRKHGVK
jgi:hypothetical protein